jgi:hypothetical protein
MELLLSFARCKEQTMNDKFNPAPDDKHAEDPKQAARKDGEADRKLEKDLKDSFPASDPASSTQPSKTTPDAGLNRRRDGVSNGVAAYEIIGTAGEWRVRHDGNETKESAFEAAVAAASLALWQGHEVRITAPASKTATGAAS